MTYFALRSYRDGGEHFDSQIGSEPTPQEFLEALWAATAEMVRVLKPSGSLWINLGDKYAGSGGHNNNGLTRSLAGVAKGYANGESHQRAARRNGPDRYVQESGGVPAKSLMGLPWRYAIGCIDRLGLILRAEVVWSKPTAMPESVADRVRRTHEQLFHFTKQGRYFAAVDEVRESYSPEASERRRLYGNNEGKDGLAGLRCTGVAQHGSNGVTAMGLGGRSENPLGKLPGSVWTIPSEPLIIPEAVQRHYDLPLHFAAFPQELPRRIILGWSPSGVCVECGQGRRPVVAKDPEYAAYRESIGDWNRSRRKPGEGYDGNGNRRGDGKPQSWSGTITGYACKCTPYTDHPGTGERQDRASQGFASETGNRSHPHVGVGVLPRVGPWREYHLDGWTPPPTRPAVILDPFVGTGTTVGVARALGRVGIGLDLSHDYARLARWRVERSGHFSKTAQRTHRENQGDLFAGRP